MATALEIILGSDARQALRIRRYFLAVATTGMVLLLFLLAWWGGILRGALVAFAFAMAGALVIAFYVVFRSGLNLRAADPSLTGPQMLASLLVTMTMIHGAGANHAVLLPLLLVTYMFGVFRFDTYRLMLSAAVVSNIYGAVLFLGFPGSVPGGSARMALVYWSIVTATLLFFAFMVGYMARLRMQLSRSKRSLEEAFVALEHAASHDALTGIYNRRQLNEILQQELRRAERYGTQFSVCLIDLDHFKSINDTYGHGAGDAVLAAFAGMLTDCMRDTDHVGRYGGEEFLVVMSGTSREGAIITADRIRVMAKSRPFKGLPDTFRLTVSAGMASHVKGESIEQTVTRADTALYRAKHLGRDRIEFAPE